MTISKKYEVLLPHYTEDGTITIRVKGKKRDVPAYSVSFEKIGYASSFNDARNKFQNKYPECKFPILREV